MIGSSHTPPNNAEEAAYAAYALIDALLERLQLVKVFDADGIRAIIKTAEMRLANHPNHASSRAAGFLRNAVLGEK